MKKMKYKIRRNVNENKDLIYETYFKEYATLREKYTRSRRNSFEKKKNNTVSINFSGYEILFLNKFCEDNDLTTSDLLRFFAYQNQFILKKKGFKKKGDQDGNDYTKEATKRDKFQGVFTDVDIVFINQRQVKTKLYELNPNEWKIDYFEIKVNAKERNVRDLHVGHHLDLYKAIPERQSRTFAIADFQRDMINKYLKENNMRLSQFFKRGCIVYGIYPPQAEEILQSVVFDRAVNKQTDKKKQYSVNYYLHITEKKYLEHFFEYTKNFSTKINLTDIIKYSLYNSGIIEMEFTEEKINMYQDIAVGYQKQLSTKSKMELWTEYIDSGSKMISKFVSIGEENRKKLKEKMREKGETVTNIIRRCIDDTFHIYDQKNKEIFDMVPSRKRSNAQIENIKKGFQNL